MSPLVQAARNYTHHRHILLLLSPKADTHFTVPQRVEGWVDLAGWLHTDMVYPSTDGHPSATTLIEANALPLSQTANYDYNNAQMTDIPLQFCLVLKHLFLIGFFELLHPPWLRLCDPVSLFVVLYLCSLTQKLCTDLWNFLPAVDLGTLSQAGFILDWPSLIDLHCHLEVTDAQQGRFDCNAATVRDTAKVTIEHW